MSSDEGAFWALKGQALTVGINPARMGQLAKLCNDWKRAKELLSQVIKSKNPSTYLGAVIKNLRDEVAAPISLRSSEPDVACDGRLRGWPVRKTVLTDGSPGWWVAGTLYNKDGVDVGA
jgi:hypothetical protein